MKNCIRAIIFMCGLCALLAISSIIITPAQDMYSVVDVDYKNDALVKEEDDSMEVIFIGDSECYSAFCPLKIWHDQGYKSYVCATSAQRLCDTVQVLKNTYKTQSPKVVVLEANCLYRYAGTYPSEDDVVYNNVAAKLPVLKYHSRWKSQLPTTQFFNSDELNTAHWKGFKLRTSVKEYSKGKYMRKSKKKKSVPDISDRYMKEIIELCKENNSELLLVSVPSAKIWNYERHNGVKKWAKKNNVKYLDLNLKKSDINIDWSTDTKDRGDHLNSYGALKVSEYMGKYLKEHYKLECSNNNADEWNSLYDEMMEKMQ